MANERESNNNLWAKAILCTCFFQYLQMKLGGNIVSQYGVVALSDDGLLLDAIVSRVK
jgi:hypothetical protein